MPEPRVLFSITDNTPVVPTAGALVFAMALPLTRGAVGKPIFINDNSDFLQKATLRGKISVGASNSHFSVLKLSKRVGMYLSRAADNPLFGGLSVKSRISVSGNTPFGSGLADPDAYTFDSEQFTRYLTEADVNGSLGGKHILFSSDTVNYYIWLQTNGAKEITTLTNTNTGSFFDVSGDGLYFTLNAAPGNISHYFWLNVTDGSNTQTDPAPSGTGHQIDILLADTANDIASKIQAALDALTDFTATVLTNVVTVTNANVGVVTVGNTWTSGLTVVQTYVGRNADTDPNVASRTGRMVAIEDNDTANEIATLIRANITAIGGFTVTGSANEVKFFLTNLLPPLSASTVGTTSWSVFTQDTDVDVLVLYAKDPGSWNNEIGVRIKNSVDTPTLSTFYTNVFQIEVFLLGNTNTPVELFLCSFDPSLKDTDGESMYVETVLERSQYLSAKDNTAVSKTLLPKESTSVLFLAGGDNGGLVTDSHMINALNVFENKDSVKFRLMLDGGYTTGSFHTAMLALVNARKDHIAFLSSPLADERTTPEENVVEYKNSLPVNEFAAMFSPHSTDIDNFNKRTVFIDPATEAAIRFTENQSGPNKWKPRANKFGVLSVTGLSVTYSSGQLSILYDNGINPTKFEEGRGFRIWGNKTLSPTPSQIQNLHMMWLVSELGPRLISAGQDFLLDLHEPALRQQLSDSLNFIAQQYVQEGGLFEAIVVADGTNNTATDVVNKRLNARVFIAGKQAVETLSIDLTLSPTDSSFSIVTV